MKASFQTAALLGVLACERGATPTDGPRDTARLARVANADSLAVVHVAQAALIAASGWADLASDSVTIFRLDTAGTVVRFGRPAFCGAYTNCYRPSAVVLVRPNGKAELIPELMARRFVRPDSGT